MDLKNNMWDCVRIIIPPTSCFWVYRTPQDFHIMVLLPSHQIKWPSTVGALLFQSKSKSPLSMYPWDPSFFACPMRAELAAGIGSSPWLYWSSWKYLQISFVWNTLDLISEAKQQCLKISQHWYCNKISITIMKYENSATSMNHYEPAYSAYIRDAPFMTSFYVENTFSDPPKKSIGLSHRGMGILHGFLLRLQSHWISFKERYYLGMAIVAGIFDGEMYAYFRGQYGNFMI